jgi:hypothetical protein
VTVPDAQEYTERARKLRDLASSTDLRTEILVSLSPCFTWSDTSEDKWAVRVELPRTTASGRKGKPDHVLTLLNTSVAAVLRDLAVVFDVDGPEISDPAPTDGSDDA